MISVRCLPEIGREEVNLKEWPEKTMKLVLVAPKSIKSKGSRLISLVTSAREMAWDSISKAKGSKPAFLTKER